MNQSNVKSGDDVQLWRKIRMNHLPRGHLTLKIVATYIITFLLLDIPSARTFGAADDQPVPKSIYHFELTKGHGTAVCDANLKLLRSVHFSKPPNCGIPEDDSVPGFSKLNRVPLTEDEGVSLFSHIYWFSKNQNQFLRSEEYPSSRVREFYRTAVNAWTYAPEISLNNDGQPDHVMIWQGAGAGAWVPPVNCGEKSLDVSQTIIITPQYAFILTKNHQEVDEGRTRKMLQHSDPSLSPYPFSPLGFEEGIFRYNGLYYLEVFYSHGLGDFHGERKNDPQIDNTLAVSLRRNGTTKQVCEYHFSLHSHRAKSAANQAE